MEIIETGYVCKECNKIIFGNYTMIETKMYFRCECKCSKWLVRSTHLNKTFNKKSSVFSYLVKLKKYGLFLL